MGRGRRGRSLLSLAVGLAVAAALVLIVLKHEDEFVTAIERASLWVLAVTIALQVVALVARTEAWHWCVQAAGGTIERRPLYRAAGFGYLGSQLNAQVGTAARIAALRRAHPDESPKVAPLIAAEVPIIVVEGLFGAVASFTLIGPLGLPWWAPIVGIVVVIAVSELLRRVARGHRQGWRTGLAVLGHLQGRNRTIFFVMVAVAAQIVRNWVMLHAVGVEASFFDATAVLIAMALFAQLPIGPSTGASAVVAILGAGGMGAAVAAGVLLTATGAMGALVYVAWAGLDGVWERRRAVKDTVAGFRVPGAPDADDPRFARGDDDREPVVAGPRA